MGITCWAQGCRHNNMRDTCKFFRFPMHPVKLRKWLKLLGRHTKPGSGARICSCHFQGGNKENELQMLPRIAKKSFGEHYLQPSKRKRKLFAECQDNSSTVPSSAEETINLPGPSTNLPPIPITSTSALEAENYLLKLEIEKKDDIIRNLRLHFSYTNICEREDLILEYTGLPTHKQFEACLFLISNAKYNYYLKWKVQKLDTADQLLMTLMKLRQNFPHVDLAYRFHVSAATVTNVIVTFIHLLHEILFMRLMKTIPKRSKNKSCLPNCASTFTNCRIILDCTEVYSAVPRQSMENQKLTYSSYKHRNTLKALVGASPNGVITYTSDLYPGSTSDKAIVASCGILQQMEPGDLILADKGFLIKDLLPAGVSVNVPPFLMTPQFTPEQVRQTECIARARIHVERAIRRMKTFKILGFIPTSLFPYCSLIFKAIAGLTNLQYPLINEVAQFYSDAE